MSFQHDLGQVTVCTYNAAIVFLPIILQYSLVIPGIHVLNLQLSEALPIHSLQVSDFDWQ